VGTKAIAVLAIFGLIVSGCSSDDDDKADSSVKASDGGEIIIGADQEPDCTDWIASCSGSSWGFWALNVGTMPRAFRIVRGEGNTYSYQPSVLLEGEPELVTEPKQVVTYQIAEDAVWSDGAPITSTDFKYTWDQIANGEDIYDQTGYQDIEAVDDTNPKTAVVTFAKPYGSWRGLFGGGYGIMPSHLLDGKDRSVVMKDGYEWSGGPWKIEKWEKGVEAVLVPNESFFGPKPKLSKVTFRFIPDLPTQFQAFKGGEVSAIYPQAQPEVIDAIADGIENTESEYGANTANIEALWMNNQKAPFDSKRVRQAVAYAIDRDVVVERLFGEIGVSQASQSFDPPALEEYSGTPFDKYTLDLDKVSQLLSEDGYTKNSEGFWEKDGQVLNFELKTTEGNPRRKLTAEILQSLFEDAGMKMTVNLRKAGDLFGTDGPNGDFQIALYAQVATQYDPNNCVLFCSGNIPVEPDFSGQNWTRSIVEGADDLLAEADAQLDVEARIEANKSAMKLLAEDMVSLPLDPLPDILLWSSAVKGPSDNAFEGPFWNLETWTMTK
jgi:peptide/nickel transport system substrate-binding protein